MEDDMSKATKDQFGRFSYRNYHIEPWKNGSWSIYNHYNSMYDCKDGFKSVDEATAWIDANR